MPDPLPPNATDPSEPRIPAALRVEPDDGLDPQFPDLDGLDLDHRDLSYPDARTVTVLRSRMRAGSLDVGDATIDAQDAQFVDIDLRGRRFEGLTRVSFVRCRLTGADFGDARLRDVRFSDCALDVASMRSATLERVAFVGGRIDELDLSAARVTDTTITQVGLANVTLAGARLERVDVTGADLAAVADLRELRGTIISPTQAVALSARLAQVAGMHVAADDD
ncbi:pentapeptide repeat-containing protein [Actinospongicola halichondriae]|uniref:pentapeptide repeat-containing protein n=1 Tax=Actinospongicola halichondriae TaxID=3236844 RepID=UPI003D5AB8AB